MSTVREPRLVTALWVGAVVLAVVIIVALFLGGCATIHPPVPPPVPTPSPSPVPVPLPTPTPEPTPASCQVTRDAAHFVDLRIGHIGTNPQLYSATALYCGFPLLNIVFPVCGTKCCTLGVDGKSDAAVLCEQEWSGIPEWKATDGLVIIPAWGGNPYNVKIKEGSGKLKACGKSGCSNEVSYP